MDTQLTPEIQEIARQLEVRGVEASSLAPLRDLPNSLPKGGSRHYFQDLFRKSLESGQPLDWNRFPAFRVFTEYSILQEEIDGVRFFSEIRELEDLILRHLGLGKREAKVLQLSQDRVLLERILKLEVLMQNHLKHHENLLHYFIFPLLVGLIVILAKLFFWS